MSAKTKLIFSCLCWIAICLIIAGTASWVTAAGTSTWYHLLNKPAFNPPAFVFGPVWTILYVMIGIAGGLIWHNREKHQILLIFFIIQLLFNFLWSFLFFGGESIGWALIDILLLWVSLLITIIYSYKHYKVIGYWLTPYFLWVTFAAILNFSLWLLN